MHRIVEGHSHLWNIALHECPLVRINRPAKLVLTDIAIRIRHSRRADKRKAHDVAFGRIAILAIVENRHAVPVLRKIRKLVTAHLKLGIVPRGVAMSRTLENTKLRIVRGVIAGDIHGELELQESVLFAPINLGVEADVAESVRLVRSGDGVENDLHRDAALTDGDLRLDDTADRAVLDDAELFKLEVRLLFERELVDVPRTTSALSRSNSLPVIRIVFHDDQSAGLAFGDDLASISADPKGTHPSLTSYTDVIRPSLIVIETRWLRRVKASPSSETDVSRLVDYSP